ncbi:MAG: pentapeptide repeat-containing protein [Patulibacter sp.]
MGAARSQGSPVAPDLQLRSDCSRCFGLCCVAPAFAKSSDFAFDKGHGEPCRNLDRSFRCRIHTRLRDAGCRGCVVFECFGAGQRVSQETFAGVSWHEAPPTRTLMFEAFAVMRPLHELLAYLREAANWPAAHILRPKLKAAFQHVNEAAALPAAQLVQVDVDLLREPAAQLLRQASELARIDAVGARAAARTPGPDLIGASLRQHNLRGAALRGARLIAADLRGADLRHADMIGADLRDADLRATDLTGALFLTESQLQAANGDVTTRISPTLRRPEHWGG